MELIITIAYVFLVRLVFFDWHLLRFNIFWKFVVFGLYALAALTEVTLLGQRTPYTKELFVQAYVIQMAPNLGGVVEEVFVKPNTPVKKGDPLFRMDPTVEQAKVDQLEAALAAANTQVAELNQQLLVSRAELEQAESDLLVTRDEYARIKEAAELSAASQLRLDDITKQVASLEAKVRGARATVQRTQLALDSEIQGEHTAVAEVIAELEEARYNLKHTTMYAPSDGYAANLQLHPGQFIRLKQPVMSFVSTEEYWMVGKVLQAGSQWIRAGDPCEVAFMMYPGKVFPAEVVSIVFATGNAQGMPSGRLPRMEEIRPTLEFAVRLRLTEDDPAHRPEFGASGIAAIYTSRAEDFLVFLRKIEIRSESFLFYVFNPF